MTRKTTPTRAKAAVTFYVSAVGGALFLALVSRASFGGPAERIAAIAMSLVAFGFVAWFSADFLASLVRASDRCAFTAAVDAAARKRTTMLEAANKELANLARTDPMTGLLNRRGLEEQAKRSIAHARRRNTPLTAIMFDIDHFKSVNDRFGHDVGDAVIQEVAKTLGIRLRETDVIARTGGEEYVVLLPDTGAEGAVIAANGILKAVRGLRVDRVGELTLSAGIALAQLGEDMPSLLRRADEALYMAKDQGRNQVVVQEYLEPQLKLVPKLAAVA
jgi:diguanylate cyclase (GGDEF)-like protein